MLRLNLIMWEKKNGYKGKWVAEQLGTSRVAWSLIKNGKRMPTYTLVCNFHERFPAEDVFELFKMCD